MTREELKSLGLAIFGYGWQTKIAKALNVNARRVRAWLKDDRTPGWVDHELDKLMGAIPAAPAPCLPRDEWIVGDGSARDVDGARAEYIVHTQSPRFIARIVDESGDTPEQEADTLSGLVYMIDEDTALCEFIWIDPAPSGKAMLDLMERAADAIHAMA